jgi:integrase
VTPVKNVRRHSLKLDRVFPGVGRIQRSSGTHVRETFNALNAMLSTLFLTGRLDLLRQIRERAIEPLVIYDAYRRGKLVEIPDALALRPLLESFTRWREAGNKRKGQPWSRWYAAAHKDTERRLTELARPFAKITDLPAILLQLRENYRDRRSTFDHHRVSCLSFARAECGRQSPTYLQLAAIEAYSAKRERAPKPLTVAELVAWTTARDADTPAKLDAETAACCWAMATTGMGPGEYWSYKGGPSPAWERHLDRVQIHGTKRAARERAVPDLGRCKVAPAISRQAFEDRLVDQTGGAFQPYDLRRSYANFLEQAGLPRTRVMLYLGHAIRNVTDLYTTHEVSQFLRDDAKRLRTWMTAETLRLPLRDAENSDEDDGVTVVAH